MPSAWRIFKSKHTATAFTGEGARLHGGRWNSPGRPVVYTAEHASLAALEMLVHLAAPGILNSYVLCEVTFNDQLITSVTQDELPDDWRSDPPPVELAYIGDDWIDARSSAVLRVPSAVIDVEFNYLLNPAHEQFDEISIGKPREFLFDDRLVN